jgi:Arc/MetJ family transcription regulator
MGTSVVIDDNLLAEARRLTGLKETTDVMREALRALIERESARRLARLGGSEPELREIPRRRSEPARST